MYENAYDKQLALNHIKYTMPGFKLTEHQRSKENSEKINSSFEVTQS